MNDFLYDEHNDARHSDAVFSTGTDAEVPIDVIGEWLTKEHSQRDVNITLDWVTWAEEDIDFWVWFWEWYWTVDDQWTFDHEPGEVVIDPNYEWEWF